MRAEDDSSTRKSLSRQCDVPKESVQVVQATKLWRRSLNGSTTSTHREEPGNLQAGLTHPYIIKIWGNAPPLLWHSNGIFRNSDYCLDVAFDFTAEESPHRQKQKSQSLDGRSKWASLLMLVSAGLDGIEQDVLQRSHSLGSSDKCG